jgi:hypothetical protein
VENGAIQGQEKEKMSMLLKRKAWNPYAFRHSSLTDYSDRYPEQALKKKARWSPSTRQENRYVKSIFGEVIKNKMSQDAGIATPESHKAKPAVHQCTSCNYVNNYESEICVKCAAPLTDVEAERRSKQRDSKMQTRVDERLRDKDQEIQSLKEQMAKMQGSQLRIIEMLKRGNPNFPQSVLDMCDQDTEDAMAAVKRGEKLATVKTITDSDGKLL